MGGLKEIRRRISSVKNTKQITRAMKLVSAAKLRRAQDMAVNGRAFSDHLQQMLVQAMSFVPDADKAKLFGERTLVRNRLVVVVSADRGLCGAYNSNLVKGAQANLIGNRTPATVFVLGRKALSAGKRLGWTMTAEYEGMPEDISTWPINKIAEKVLADFRSGAVDEVDVIYTKFISTMTQRVQVDRLLPLTRFEATPAPGVAVASAEKVEGESGGILKFSPEPADIALRLIPLFVAAKLRQAAVEAKASEHASRMTAMDSATNNANDLIDRLKLFYNRARQTAITRELIDIVGGAEAIK